MFKPGDRIVNPKYMQDVRGNKHKPEFYTGTVIGVKGREITVVYDDFNTNGDGMTELFVHHEDREPLVTEEAFNSPLYKALHED